MTTRILFLHGYLDAPETWGRLIAAWRRLRPGLADADCVAITVREAADDCRTSASILERFRDQAVEDARAAGGADRWLIVGHSMGGAIAELVATSGALPVAGIALITPVPLGGARLPAAMRERFEHSLAHRTPESMRLARQALSKSLDDAALDLMVGTSSRTTVARARQQLAAWDGGHPDGARASAATCPVLMVTTDDPFFDRQVLTAQAGRFADATIRHVDGAGHWCHVERSEALADVLDAFAAARVGFG